MLRRLGLRFVFTNASASCRVRGWVTEVVVRQGLCPWAAKAQIKISETEKRREDELLEVLHCEAKLLHERSWALATTLLVCTNLNKWDARQFDAFVQAARVEGISLVAFHPDFDRWREPSFKAGDRVRTHFSVAEADEEACARAQRQADESEEPVDVDCVFRKSSELCTAVVVSMDEADLGVRTVRLRFDEDGEEEDVPLDWIKSKRGGQLMGDCKLHRSPLPVIHLLKADELAVEADRAGEDAIEALRHRNASLARLREAYRRKHEPAAGSAPAAEPAPAPADGAGAPGAAVPGDGSGAPPVYRSKRVAGILLKHPTGVKMLRKSRSLQPPGPPPVKKKKKKNVAPKRYARKHVKRLKRDRGKRAPSN
ncbi:hypothetical protein M885DRAFT_537774 [Pelagophyceae sp. CCMP2097]|nr:hypothetical protein M885DRAFT_537774 [Pelagophyceae sp. CCMP2097]